MKRLSILVVFLIAVATVPCAEAMFSKKPKLSEVKDSEKPKFSEVKDSDGKTHYSCKKDEKEIFLENGQNWDDDSKWIEAFFNRQQGLNSSCICLRRYLLAKDQIGPVYQTGDVYLENCDRVGGTPDDQDEKLLSQVIDEFLNS